MLRNQAIRTMTALLLALTFLAAACGSDGDEQSAFVDGEVLRIGMVAPSASNDVAFTQSMVDSINRIGETREVELDVTDGTFDVEVAAEAIRGYAEADFDLVIAHGSQYGDSLQEIAPEFPEVSFAWGTAADTFGIENVYSYAVKSDEGGYVIGTLAAQVSESNVIGVVGPVEVGDAALYINGFAAGVEAQNADVVVNVDYIGSFSDVALAAGSATTHIDNGADVLTGTSQMVVGATGVASQADVPWFGTQSNQTVLSPNIVVASQVYRWEVILEEMISNIGAGTLGGEVYTLTLANGGLVIEYNEDFDLDPEARSAADAVVEGVIDGSISTGS